MSKAGPATTSASYHCDYCSKDISSVVRIRCAECVDFDLCLECFSVGVEVVPHVNTHKYRVIDHVTTPIFEPDWGADEELLLLEGISSYGLGNWDDISDHVGPGKSKAQCEQHYMRIYLQSATAPLPDLSRALGAGDGKGDAAPLPPSSSSSSSSSSNGVKAEQAPEDDLPDVPGTTLPVRKKAGFANLVGYVPLRGDFDTEYDNEAELVLAEMEFSDEDTELDRQLKLRVLEIYNARLDARLERKKFVLERNMLDPNRTKHLAPEAKAIERRLRPFARFHSAEDHENFILGLVREKQIRDRITRLQSFRLHGIKTLEDGKRFEEKNRAASSAEPKRGKKRVASAAAIQREAYKRQREGGDLDITGMDGADLLSQAEVALCSTLRIVPRHYMMIKEQIVRESFARGFVSPEAASTLIKIDINKSNKLFDFFVTAGWVTSQPAAADKAAPATSSAPAASSSSSSST